MLNFGSGGDLIFAGLESFRQEHMLRFYFRQLQGFSELSSPSVGRIQARLEFAEHGIEQIIGLN
jgi:hypothetical protein